MRKLQSSRPNLRGVLAGIELLVCLTILMWVLVTLVVSLWVVAILVGPFELFSSRARVAIRGSSVCRLMSVDVPTTVSTPL